MRESNDNEIKYIKVTLHEQIDKVKKNLKELIENPSKDIYIVLEELSKIYKKILFGIRNCIQKRSEK